MTHIITVDENVYYSSTDFDTLWNAHEVDLDPTDEIFVNGSYTLEVEVTGDNAAIFVELYEAIFN